MLKKEGATPERLNSPLPGFQVLSMNLYKADVTTAIAMGPTLRTSRLQNGGVTSPAGPSWFQCICELKFVYNERPLAGLALGCVQEVWLYRVPSWVVGTALYKNL